MNKEGKQRILANILPWIDKLRLDVSTQNVQDHNLVRLHLNNFMYLTLQFGDELEREIEALWFRLVANVKNTRPLVQYLLQLCLERKDVQLPAFCNRVIVYVGRTSAFDKLVELLMGEVTPKSLIVQKNVLTQYESVQCDIHIPGFFTAPLDKLLSDPARKVNYSRGQLVTVFIVDFAIEKGKYLGRSWDDMRGCEAIVKFTRRTASRSSATFAPSRSRTGRPDFVACS